MALIPVHFTVAAQFNIDNSNSGVNALGLQAGQLVTLIDGTKPPVSDSTPLHPGLDDPFVEAASATSTVIGIAGDSFRSDLPATASGYAADIVINPAGDTTRSQDRISDMYKETLASGQVTVYLGSGVFHTTMFDTHVGVWTLGQKLYSNSAGFVTNISGGGDSVGKLVGKPTSFPSGVPGTDCKGSISLGNYLTLALNV